MTEEAIPPALSFESKSVKTQPSGLSMGGYGAFEKAAVAWELCWHSERFSEVAAWLYTRSGDEMSAPGIYTTIWRLGRAVGNADPLVWLENAAKNLPLPSAALLRSAKTASLLQPHLLSARTPPGNAGRRPQPCEADGILQPERSPARIVEPLLSVTFYPAPLVAALVTFQTTPAHLCPEVKR